MKKLITIEYLMRDDVKTSNMLDTTLTMGIIILTPIWLIIFIKSIIKKGLKSLIKWSLK